MSNNTAFRELLPRADSFDQFSSISLYHGPETSEETRRAIAVGCALELISSHANNKNDLQLQFQMQRLSLYADQIQEALKLP